MAQAKQRKAVLAPRAAPQTQVAPAPGDTTPPPEPPATPSSAPPPSAEPTRSAPVGRTRKDPRDSGQTAALYARVPPELKRRLNITAAMTGRSLSDVVAALLDAYVDPQDADKYAALENLLNAYSR